MIPERVIALTRSHLPAPIFCAAIALDRGAERHRRHLDIGPQLHGDAEGGGGVDALRG